jgi:pyruvate/2-oxoglutarate/acetoin dehydrogenase E1 component/TPP-dependent pyruvate/acetoin dehydrogenase alpha subunit
MEQQGVGESSTVDELSFEGFRQAVIFDYKIAFQSRQASLLGRKEVLTGKAKFGIFGDGKEVPQVAMAKFFKEGDFYAGYYRDQTFAFATGVATVPEFFSQLYADPNPENDSHSAGRQMNCHFATPFIDKDGNLLDLSKRKNFSSGMAPTAGHFPKALGLAYASKLFKQIPGLDSHTNFTSSGNEVVFCTIGDASTSEGHFWETMNAAAVSQVPLAVFVWDDGYGISVPKELQTVKSSISEALSGFEKAEHSNGIIIYKVKGWDYANLCEVFEEGISRARNEHIPVLFHVEELTQPQGHSTSGSHERYKTPERLQWERSWDCLLKMRSWIIDNALYNDAEIVQFEDEIRTQVAASRVDAWKLYDGPIQAQKATLLAIIEKVASQSIHSEDIWAIHKELSDNSAPFRRDIMVALRNTIFKAADPSISQEAVDYLTELSLENKKLFNSHLYLHDNEKIGDQNNITPIYDEDAPFLNGYEILNKFFDETFSKNPLVVAFGEDLGKIGDVNQGFAGLQQKYGSERIFDTGIRELTIIGQGVGLSMRGLRPIAEIQYLDYLLFGLQVLSDDASTLHYRSAGQQIAPLIVRTRGHRLEGIWHSGSPMGLMINALKGLHVCVPRNMVQAVGFYNTLLEGKNPGIVVECLNGYRLKERLPASLTEFKLPLGVPEVIREGTDLTLVSYGSTLRIASEAATLLSSMGIEVEVIDVQTLLPFDLYQGILASLKKTNRILFVDEDVPGGATSFMFSEVLEKQGGYRWLDASPKILCSKSHRPSYGSDGDYFSKPNVEDIVQVVSQMMVE